MVAGQDRGASLHGGNGRPGGGRTSFGAWPFSAEWLSAVFDYNVAPFFQSFVEVKVEPSAHRVRVIPYGVHGRLTWGEVGLVRHASR